MRRLLRHASLPALVLLIGGSGALHLTTPKPYERIVPRALGHAPAIVLISGIAELICAALMVAPPTRRVGGWAAAILLVAVFPANIQMALDGGARGAGFPLDNAIAAWLRLPLQPLLIWWVLAATRSAQR